MQNEKIASFFLLNSSNQEAILVDNSLPIYYNKRLHKGLFCFWNSLIISKETTIRVTLSSLHIKSDL
jgi:hypothetical protein